MKCKHCVKYKDCRKWKSEGMIAWNGLKYINIVKHEHYYMKIAKFILNMYK